jgi:hypothetical protein
MQEGPLPVKPCVGAFGLRAGRTVDLDILSSDIDRRRTSQIVA